MIKLAVIGCGYWGKNLVRNFSELGVLACICDPDVEAAKKVSKEFNVDIKSFEKILSDDDINSVAIAVPAELHYEYALKALESKKNVFVEKPIALKEEHAAKLISISNLKKRVLMVGHLLHYHPAFKKITKLKEDGTLGVIKHICSNRMSFGKIRDVENVLWSFAPHDISMVLELAGNIPKYVSCQALDILQEGIQDICSIQLSFDNNITALINSSWLNPFKEHKLTVIGTKGMCVFDDTKAVEQKLCFIKYSFDKTQSLKISKSEPEFLDIPDKEPLKHECQHFIDCVESNLKPKTDGNEGIKVLKVLEAAEKSCSENKRVRVI